MELGMGAASSSIIRYYIIIVCDVIKNLSLIVLLAMLYPFNIENTTLHAGRHGGGKKKPTLNPPIPKKQSRMK